MYSLSSLHGKSILNLSANDKVITVNPSSSRYFYQRSRLYIDMGFRSDTSEMTNSIALFKRAHNLTYNALAVTYPPISKSLAIEVNWLTLSSVY